MAPDDVFSQCGVQFRLASYVAVEVPSDIYGGEVRRAPVDVVTNPSLCRMVPTRPDADTGGDCILGVVEWEDIFQADTQCGSGTLPSVDARGDAIEIVIELAKSIPRNNLLTGMTGETGAFEGINVVLMGSIGGGLLDVRCPGLDLGLTSPNAWVAVATDAAGAEPTTLSHELGHQLLGSSEHLDYGANLAIDLMKEGGGDGFHIPGCQTWQHDFSGLPVGCDAGAVASVEVRNLCEEMRGFVPPPPPAPLRMEPGDPLDFLSRRWTYGRFSWGGVTEALFSDVRATEGSNSITVPIGYTDIASPSFLPADLPEVGDRLSVDVYIPSPVANPYWVGAVALFVDIPAAGIYNQWVSQHDLTPLTRGAWSTLEFALPTSVVAALRSDLPGVQLIVAVNTGTAGLLIDHLRFAGDVAPQDVEHIEGSLPHDVSLLPMGGFEVLADWTPSPAGGVTLETVTVLDGQAALEIEPGGVRVLESGAFDTEELAGISDTLSIDVFVPNPQPNPWWVGEVQLFASCPSAGLFDQWLGQEALTNLFTDEYNQLQFEVPPAVREAWEGDYSDCSVSIVLNTNAGAGAFLLDRLGFL